MSRYLNSRFASMEAYVPGEQPQDQVYVKLNTNESPYPPSPGVLTTVNGDAAAALRLYPDPVCGVLRRKLGELFGVGAENISLSNGSDDMLNLAFLAFGAAGVVFPDISYGFYEVFAGLHGLSYDKIPLQSDFSVNPGDYLHTGRMVVIANPNAPTGLCLGLDAVEQIVCENPDRVVLIDEAYVDFGGESAIPLTKQYDNLLVVGTFSKSRCMAGARLGFAVAGEKLIADLEKLRYSTNPYNINRLTMAAGIAAVGDNAYYQRRAGEIIKTRTETADALCKRGFVMTDSKANFLFTKSDRIDGGELYGALKKRGVLVRHFDAPRIRDYNRITVGTPNEMQRLLDAVDAIMEEQSNA